MVYTLKCPKLKWNQAALGECFHFNILDSLRRHFKKDWKTIFVDQVKTLEIHYPMLLSKLACAADETKPLAKSTLLAGVRLRLRRKAIIR